jgi:hypothetical protein
MEYLNKLEKRYLFFYIIIMIITIILGFIGTALDIQNMKYIMTVGFLLLMDLILLIVMGIYVAVTIIIDK